MLGRGYLVYFTATSAVAITKGTCEASAFVSHSICVRSSVYTEPTVTFFCCLIESGCGIVCCNITLMHHKTSTLLVCLSLSLLFFRFFFFFFSFSFFFFLKHVVICAGKHSMEISLVAKESECLIFVAVKRHENFT